MRSVCLLDTSVLLHDPAALFRFGDNDVYLPLAVLHGLDAARHAQSEEARNALQAARFLDDLLGGAAPADLERGLPLGEGLGRLHFLTDCRDRAPAPVLEAAQSLANTHPDVRVTVVARDINLRIQANVLGLHAIDHEAEAPLGDSDLLPDGVQTLPGEAAGGAAGEAAGEAASGAAGGAAGEAAGGAAAASTAYLEHLAPNEFLLEDADAGDAGSAPGMLAGVWRRGPDGLLPVSDYGPTGQSVWGIHARNRQQSLALELLMDPEVELVTLLGPAGTGKTLLTLAAGLAQTLEESRYHEILMTRATIAIGEDIGYLPGTEEEKMTPWMGALMDNLEVLSPSSGAGYTGSNWAQAASQDLLRSRIQVRSLNFMRGRTFLNRYLVLDEAQNLTPQQMRTLITRAGPGTKIVCLGNLSQIDTPWLTPTTSGLTYVVRRFRDWAHSGHLTLTRGERSRLAAQASEVL